MAGPLPVHELDISIGPLPRAEFPHRHTFYEIALVTKEPRPPMLCFALPGQARLWRGATGLEGKVILFTSEFLDAYPRDREVLRALGSVRALVMSKKDGMAFEAVVREMEQEYRSCAPGCTAILQACLHILLLRASRLSRARGPLPPAGGTASIRRRGA